MKIRCFLLALLAVLWAGSIAFAANAKTGTITGTLQLAQGGPLANGVVLFFNAAGGPPPSHGKYWRVPDGMVNTDAAGKFTAVLPAGTYYLTAVKRAAGRTMGPPQQGDFYLPSLDKEGKPRECTVREGEVATIGTVAGAVPFQPQTNRPAAGGTAIEGVVSDETGKPAAGVLVFAFASPAMVGTPLFASDKTGPDGRYVLRVDHDGTYFLKIRESYGGGIPKPGELIGSYGEKDKPVPVTVKSGSSVTGIDIKGHRYTGRGIGLRLQ